MCLVPHGGYLWVLDRARSIKTTMGVCLFKETFFWVRFKDNPKESQPYLGSPKKEDPNAVFINPGFLTGARINPGN